MSSTIDRIKALLLEEIQEKIKYAPFGFGQKEGCEGFPKWSVYIDSENNLYGHPSLTSRFSQEKTVLENLATLPVERLTLLVEKGLTGEELFKQMHGNYVIGNGMGGKAWEDANLWLEGNKSKIKP